MRSAVRVIAALVGGYLLGTTPSADVAARLAGGHDLRSSGSGNPGAVNAAKVLGARYGLAVLAVDIGKGASAGVLGRRLAGSAGAHVGSTAAVVGHCYPVWTRFRGGKGVATGVGQVLATFPAYVPIDLAVAVATSVSRPWRERAFAATAGACGVWVASALLWWRRGWSAGWGQQATGWLPLGAAVSSAVIIGRFVAARRSGPAGERGEAPGEESGAAGTAEGGGSGTG